MPEKGNLDPEKGHGKEGTYGKKSLPFFMSSDSSIEVHYSSIATRVIQESYNVV